MTALASLPVTLRLGPVHLVVTDLDRSISWYEQTLGLILHSRESGIAQLGDAGSACVILHENPSATQPGNHAHLFHYCLLFDTRQELARTALRIDRAGAPVKSRNDRHTHEAIYINDPDGITIELAWDKPREFWPAEPYGHAPAPLDMDGLLATVTGEEPRDVIRDAAMIGHLHFVTGGIDESIAFYRDLLGFDLKYNVGSENYAVHAAAFFSVGGYHHQVATNLLAGTDVGPFAENVVGLKSWTIELPPGAAVETRARLESGGAKVTAVEQGFVAYDPWSIPVQICS
jgi:catechol 2,3-dioxygenase